jgi:hypothetical protein
LKLVLYGLLAQAQKVDLHFFGQSKIAERLQEQKVILHLASNEWPTLEAFLAENANGLPPDEEAFLNNLLASQKLGGRSLTAQEHDTFATRPQILTTKSDSGKWPWPICPPAFTKKIRPCPITSGNRSPWKGE